MFCFLFKCRNIEACPILWRKRRCVAFFRICKVKCAEMFKYCSGYHTATDIVLPLNWASRKQYNLKTEEIRRSAQNALRLVYIGYSRTW